MRCLKRVEIFNVWEIDFMGLCPSSNENEYIFLTIDYVSKWVEAIATAKNDVQTLIKFLKMNVFTRFGVLRALISNEGSQFINKSMKQLLIKYGVNHKVSTLYHPQTNDNWRKPPTKKSNPFLRRESILIERINP